MRLIDHTLAVATDAIEMVVVSSTATPPGSYPNISERERVDLLPELQKLLQSVLAAISTFEVRTPAIKAAADAATISKLAEDAATAVGATGAATLSLHFSKFAGVERKSANWFRAATIIVILAAVAVALLVPHVIRDGQEPTVGGTTTRFTVAAAVLGLAGYCGRQAGQHRRNAHWGATVSVQLDSMNAFMAAAPNEATRSAVFQTFANRVLRAPPESGKEAAPDANPMMLQVIETLLRQSK